MIKTYSLSTRSRKWPRVSAGRSWRRTLGGALDEGSYVAGQPPLDYPDNLSRARASAWQTGRMDAGDIPWQLGAQVSPTNPGAKVSFAALRELSREDAEQAQESSRFLERLAAATGYAQLVDAYQQLDKALKRQSTPERRAIEMNSAARALGAIAADFSDGLRRSAEQDFGEASEQLAQIEAAISEETARPPFRLLVAVGSLNTGPFIALGGGIGIESEALSQLATAVDGVGPGLDLMASLFSGVVVAQRLIGRQLQTYASLINNHSLRLRQLAAEVPDGRACLFRWRSMEGEAGSKRKMTMDVVALPLDKGVLLHRALSFTQQFLKSTSGSQIRSAPPPASDPRPPLAAQVVDPVGVGDEGSSPPAQEAKEFDDQAQDLDALAKHATEFCDELERAWSTAMDRALLAEAQQETQARYASLLSAVQRRASSYDRALQKAGVDPGLPAFPTPPHEAARYSYNSDRDQRVLQSRLAEIEAVALLLGAVVAMREPSARRTFSKGRAAETETWWEAGAFSLVRERAAHLLRVSRNTAALLDAAPEARSRSMATAFDQMRLATIAYGRGDMEASVMHVRLALFHCAAAERDDVPDDLLERLARYVPRADHANALRLVEVAAQRTAKGVLPEVAVTALVAPLALSVLGELLRAPQVFADALSEGGSEDGKEA